MAISVRTLTADEWPVWRAVTLHSLEESPDAFRPTLEETVDQPPEWWQEMVGPTAEHERGNLWVAFDGEVPLGKLFATIDEKFTTLYVGAMWVAPETRGRGVGRRLMDAAMEWARAKGVSSAELWVTEANEAAVRFYGLQGFAPTADTQFLREGSTLVVRKLTMPM